MLCYISAFLLADRKEKIFEFDIGIRNTNDSLVYSFYTKREIILRRESKKMEKTRRWEFYTGTQHRSNSNREYNRNTMYILYLVFIILWGKIKIRTNNKISYFGFYFDWKPTKCQCVSEETY